MAKDRKCICDEAKYYEKDNFSSDPSKFCKCFDGYFKNSQNEC